jgi:hypothetical protein
MKVHAALQSHDGLWRVEVVQSGQRVFYRLHHDGEVRDKLPIGVLEDILRQNGLSMADLEAVPVESVSP